MKNLIKICYLFLFLSSVNITLTAQETYIVNDRNGIEIFNQKGVSLGYIQYNEAIIATQKLSDQKWKIEYYGNSGYVNPAELVRPEASEKYKYKNLTKENLRSGNSPACTNVYPKYDFNIDNELLVKVGWNTDVVVKLYNIQDECIRIAYIKSGDNYSIKNIPEGKYYLKIAYGKDLRKFREEGRCKVKFLANPSYEKGEGILDFYNKRLPNEVKGDYIYERWNIPSYELSLNVVYNTNIFEHNEFKSDNISEDEFNDN